MPPNDASSVGNSVGERDRQYTGPVFCYSNVQVYAPAKETKSLIVSFYDKNNGGGVSAGTIIGDQGGPSQVTYDLFNVADTQLYSGLQTAPMFSTGTYTLTAAFNGGAVTTLTISNPSASAVPEPATWAMFIGGFGLIGGAMRSRKRVSVSFA
jgi:hypothetical protein